MGERSQSGRVVFVTHSSVLSGAELSLLDIAPHFPNSLVCVFSQGPLVEALRQRGVAVSVLSSTDTVLSVRRNARLAAITRAVPGMLQISRRLARCLRPGDLLYANSQKGWIAAGFAAWRGGVPVIWHLRDIMSAEHFSQLLSRLAVTLANRLATAVVVNSDATAAGFVQAGGRRELVRRVYNGVDRGPFVAAARKDRAALRRRLGFGDELVVGLFGRISPWKGQHVLLEALERLPEARALVVGAPLFGEKDYFRDLERRAYAPALAGRVKFLGYRSNVAALMCAVDVVVHTSTAPEPFGRVVVEGMLARRPVIASRGGGVNEIIEDSVDGVLVEPGNSEELARRINALAADKAQRERLAARAYEKAVRQFSTEGMLRELERVVAEFHPGAQTMSPQCHAASLQSSKGERQRRA